ncbi:hypothetical protein HQR01_15060 [Erythrobacter mangrovi]|uniref:Uncharacterized protein n=1 Tax=Erythrobacter mangrovi TaxID=2739433 RepID=A0A7D3XJE1_9SPHN|nr:hypothetical protein [Erythrobacter mangrovi]QKG72578.1 hypothetical protein HQR01_15060 [Erythrobacter mangrovi]
MAFANGLMANVDPTLGPQVLDIALAQWKAHIPQHHQADHFGRGDDIPEQTIRLALAWHPAALATHSLPAFALALTTPSRCLPNLPAED